METVPALSFRNLSKIFGGEHALKNVNLTVDPGKIHGLLGPNGSGKSTLIKVLAGFHSPEPGGECQLFGSMIDLPLAPSQFRGLGMAFVHQNLGLLPSLSVLENLRIGAFATKARWKISWRKECLLAEETFAKFGVKINPKAKIADLPPVERALVAIIRAVTDIQSNQVHQGRGLLILDEPTPFLPKKGVEQLFELIRGVVQDGSSVIFVSHDIDEVMEITDEATILRDGEVAGTLVTKDATNEQFVELIIGRKIIPFVNNQKISKQKKIDISIEGLTGGSLNDVSINLRKGEVLGLTGLMGSGFNEVPYLLYGATEAQAGKLSLDGKTIDISTLDPSVAQKFGISLIPSDRLGAGVVGKLPVVDNVTLPILDNFLNRLMLNRRKMIKQADELGREYDVRPNRSTLPLESLSGGNQQKVVMAKWLQTSPSLFLLDEPTQGVDIGARQQIYMALDKAAKKGCGILCASTDYEQLAQICDRVLIFAQGQIIQELVGNEVTKERIAEKCYLSMTIASEQDIGSPQDRKSLSGSRPLQWNPDILTTNSDFVDVVAIENRQNREMARIALQEQSVENQTSHGGLPLWRQFGWNPDLLTINGQINISEGLSLVENKTVELPSDLEPLPLNELKAAPLNYQQKRALGWNPDILIGNKDYVDVVALEKRSSPEPLTQNQKSINQENKDHSDPQSQNTKDHSAIQQAIPQRKATPWNPDISEVNQIDLETLQIEVVSFSNESKTVKEIKGVPQWNPDILANNEENFDQSSINQEEEKVKTAKVISLSERKQAEETNKSTRWNPDISVVNTEKISDEIYLKEKTIKALPKKSRKKTQVKNVTSKKKAQVNKGSSERLPAWNPDVLAVNQGKKTEGVNDTKKIQKISTATSKQTNEEVESNHGIPSRWNPDIKTINPKK